jgi:hypothetical protein
MSFKEWAAISGFTFFVMRLITLNPPPTISPEMIFWFDVIMAPIAALIIGLIKDYSGSKKKFL